MIAAAESCRPAYASARRQKAVGVRSRFGVECFVNPDFPLFPSSYGQVCSKVGVVDTINKLAERAKGGLGGKLQAQTCCRKSPRLAIAMFGALRFRIVFLSPPPLKRKRPDAH